MEVRGKLRQWAIQVKTRDNHECRLCKSKNKLHAHHVIPRNKDKNLWYDLNNGITLCASCHAKTEGYQKGHKHPKETLKKLSEKLKGRSSWNKGKKLSEQHKKNLSISHLGNKLTDETKNKLKGKKAWNKGKKASELVKKSLAEANRKTWEKRKLENLPGPRKGTKQSEESKRKTSESLKKAYAEGRRKIKLKGKIDGSNTS